MKLPIVNIATDGAYFKDKPVVTWGAVVYNEDLTEEIHQFAGMSSDPYHLKYAQVFGELQAIREALAWVIDNVETPTEVIFYYDYEGVRSWALDYWKANNALTISYKNFMFEFLKYNPGIKLTFKKVQAHKDLNARVHKMIQLRDVCPGVVEFQDRYIININTDDQRIKDFFDKLYD